MPLEVGIKTPQREEILPPQEARLGPRSIEKRCGVPLGKDEAIVVRMLRLRYVISHFSEEERRNDVRGGTACRRVAAPGFRCGANGINPKLRGDID
jgi:hypothetical protein